jgi:hypothetical protein
MAEPAVAWHRRDSTNSDVIGKVYVSVTSTPYICSVAVQPPFVMIVNNGFRREFLGRLAGWRSLEVPGRIG